MKCTVQFFPGSLQSRLAEVGRGWNSRAGQAAIPDIKAILIADAQDRALRGVDRNNRAYEPLRAERTGKYKGATGAPLDPFGPTSRVYENFRVEIVGFGSEWSLRCYWEDFDILQYHVSGPMHNPRLPIRDPRGVSIGANSRVRARIRRMMAEWKTNAV